MICSNFMHSKRFESNKFWYSNFKSRYLAQYLMNLHDSTCSMLYMLRSTKAISRFQELTWSNSHLMKMQQLDLSSSRPGNAKQVFNNDEEYVWKWNFSSIVLQWSRILIFHEHAPSSTAANLNEFFTILLQQIFTRPAYDD